MQIHPYTKPVKHWIVEDAVHPDIVTAALDAIPRISWPHWVSYMNDCEMHKRTNNKEILEIPEIKNLFEHLNCESIVSDLRLLSGIPDLVADPTLHGGGIHITDASGWLQPHLDYALHPYLMVDGKPMERRLNLVLFLNQFWDEHWGGAFELYDDMGKEPQVRIYPEFNRAALWEPTDVAIHGTQRVSNSAAPRVTAAVYYLAPAREGVTRKRALFVPNRS